MKREVDVLVVRDDEVTGEKAYDGAAVSAAAAKMAMVDFIVLFFLVVPDESVGDL